MCLKSEYLWVKYCIVFIYNWLVGKFLLMRGRFVLNLINYCDIVCDLCLYGEKICDIVVCCYNLWY